MSKEAWGDEGNVTDSWKDSQLYEDLAGIQSRLFKFYAAHKDDFPNDDFIGAYARADEAIQDMFGNLEDLDDG